MNQSSDKSKRWRLIAACGLIWLAIFAMFAALYGVARYSLVNEIRCHAMGVAIATAAGINTNDIEQIRSPDDMSKGSYRRIQEFLGQASRFNPDVRYTMSKPCAVCCRSVPTVKKCAMTKVTGNRLKNICRNIRKPSSPMEFARNVW